MDRTDFVKELWDLYILAKSNHDWDHALMFLKEIVNHEPKEKRNGETGQV